MEIYYVIFFFSFLFCCILVWRPFIAAKNISNTIMLQIMTIGLPTNVTHMGHANSPEEAAALIEKLLQPGAPGVKGTLPAPLKPGGDKSILTVERVVKSTPHTFDFPKMSKYDIVYFSSYFLVPLSGMLLPYISLFNSNIS